MELQLVSVNGFRKFETKTDLKTNGKLVALLGPNEAGKTSLLNAISMIGKEGAIPASDLSRSRQLGDKEYVLSAEFKLSPADLEAAGIAVPTWFTLH